MKTCPEVKKLWQQQQGVDAVTEEATIVTDMGLGQSGEKYISWTQRIIFQSKFVSDNQVRLLLSPGKW